MELTQQLAYDMLANIRSWILHSDDYRRLFDNKEIEDDTALEVVRYMEEAVNFFHEYNLK